MCTRNITSVDNSTRQFVGQDCPVCGGRESKVDFMRFLDPHGGERIDTDIFECSARRHTFVCADGEFRLLAADGKRCRDRKVFQLESVAD